MAKRKGKFVFTSAHISRIASVVGILFVLVVLFSVNTHARFLIAGLDFVIGTAGIYVLGAYFLYYCLFHLIFGRKRHVKKRLFFSAILLWLGLFLLLPLPGLGYGGQENVDPNVYLNVFSSTYQSLGYGFLIDPRLGGGILGYLLSGTLSFGVGRFLPILLASILLLGGIVLAFFPLIVLLIRRIKAKAALNKAEKQQRKQDELAAEVSPFGIAMPEENLAPSVEAPTAMPVKENSYPEPSAPEMPVFSPASHIAMPSRRSLRVKTQEAQETPASPLVAPSPEKPFVASSPLRTSGFHKAYFGKVDAKKEEEVVIPVEENRPVRVYAPGLEVAPEEMAKPTSVQEEAEVPVFEIPTPSLPSFTPNEKTQPEPTPVVTPIVPEPFLTPGPEPVMEKEPKEEEPLPQEEPSPAPLFTPAPMPKPQPIVPPSQPATPSSNATTVPPAPAPTPVATPCPEKKEEKPQEEEAEELPPYTLPPISLLQDMENQQDLVQMEEDCAQKEAIINKAYEDLKAGARVVGHIIGPSVTQFSIQPDANVSVATLGRFQKDLEMRLGGLPTRFTERVSGQSYCALEVANAVCRTISFKELFSGLPPLNSKNSMLVPFGEDINGKVRYADLTELPHMLVAGTTGSGKSVFIHGLLFSLLMRNRPEELKLVLVDPKRVEMNKYRDLPHLLCPIIKEPSEAKVALKKLCDEMDRRFKVFENANCQSIRDYNDDYCEVAHKKKMPFIVVVIDEFADLVGAEKEVSDHVLRIGQKARAAGIHMIIATQRPDVKIITGTIKSNLPTRIALTVASTVDSQTILGVKGAEELNGKGDMLIDCVQVAKKEFVRAQGAFVTSRDMRVIGDFIRQQMQPKYDPEFLDLSEKEEEIPGSVAATGSGFDAGPSESTLGAIKAASDEEKYQMIKAEVMKREYTSISQIQRDYSVGFPRAGKIYSRLLKEGIISLDSPNSSRGAKVVVHAETSEPASTPGSEANSETSWSEEYE